MRRLLHRRGCRAGHVPAVASGPPPELFAFADGTYTRTGTAMRWNGTGIDQWAEDVLRDLGGGWAAFEPSYTNLAVYNDVLNSWSAVGGATVNSNVADAPNGDSGTVDRVNGAGSASDRIELTYGPADNQPVAVRCLYRDDSGTDQFRIQLVANDGATADTGDTKIAGPNWASAELKANTLSGGGTARHRIRMTAVAGGVLVWGYTLTLLGWVPFGIILTSAGSSASQGADDLQYASGAGLPSWFTSGAAWQVKVKSDMSSAEMVAAGVGRAIVAFTGDKYLGFIVDSGAIKVQVYDGTTTVTTGAITFSANQEITITVAPDDGDLTVAGATTGNGTTDGSAFSFPSATTCRIAALVGGTNAWAGQIKEPTEV